MIVEMVSEESRVSGFAILDAIARNTPDLLNNERSVFSAIAAYSDGQATCFPSQTRLAKNMGKTREWVNRMVQRLVAKEYVTCRRSNGGRRSLTYEINTEKLGLAPAASAAQSQSAGTAENVETKTVPVPTPAQAPRQDPSAQTLTRVLEALGALERRMGALEQVLGRIADKLGVSAEAPTPVAPAEPAAPAAPAAPAPKSAKGKAKRPEQLPLFPEGGNTSEAEQKPAWDIEDGWRRFWDAWPDKQDKQKARKAFDKVMAKQKDPEALLQQILATVARKKTERKWREGIYMLATTFLNNARWEDEPEKERAGSGGSGGSSNRHGQKLPVSDKEIEEYAARMEGRVPDSEDEDEDEDGAPEAKEQGDGEKEGGEDCAGVNPEEGLTSEQIEWLNDHPDWR